MTHFLIHPHVLPILATILAPLFLKAAVRSDVAVVALTGQPAPGLVGPTFLLDPEAPLGVNARPLINDAGQMCFFAGANGNGIWAGDVGSLELVSHTSIDAPDVPTGVSIENYSYFLLSQSGDVLIHGRLQGPGIGFFESGIWMGPPEELHLVNRDGDPAPGTDEGVLFDRFSSMAQPSISTNQYSSNSVSTAFLANLTGAGVTPFVNDTAIWAGSQTNGHQLVARSGDQAAGFDQGTTYQYLYPPAYAGNGHFAFIGTTSGFQGGVWGGFNGNASLTISSADPVPDLPGAVFLSSSFSSVGVDNLGRVVVVGEFFGIESGWGVWSGFPGALQLVVRGGDSAPDAPGTTAKFTDLYGTPSFASQSGDVAFAAVLSGPGVNQSNQFGIWGGKSGDMQLVARQGDQVPGLHSGVVYTNLNNFLHLNDSGMIIFDAFVTGPGITETNDHGYFGGPFGAVKPIILEGDIIQTSSNVFQTVDYLPALRVPTSGANPKPMGSSDGGASVLNDQGQFVFQASFEDGSGPSGGIFLISLAVNIPSLTLAKEGSGLKLSWTGDGVTLLESENVEGPWSPASNQANPQMITPYGSRRFFLLER